MNEVFGAISVYLDECEDMRNNAVVHGVLSIVEKEPKYGKQLLCGVQEKCPVVSTVLMIKLVRDYFLHECGPIPCLLHQHSYIPIYRSLYSLFAAQNDSPSEATAKLTARLLELFSGEGLSFGDVVDSVLSTAVMMDMTTKEGRRGGGG